MVAGFSACRIFLDAHGREASLDSGHHIGQASPAYPLARRPTAGLVAGSRAIVSESQLPIIMIIQRSILVPVLFAVLAAGCGKRIKPLEPAPVSTAQADSMERARQQAMEDSLRMVREREAERLRQVAAQAEALEAAREAEAIAVITGTVYFEYDRSELSSEARATLDAKVPALQARPAFRIRITGHTDERGSSEYNLALGLRRAAELKAYLVANGISAARIDISSMGEERPAAQGSNEAAWSQNRRAEFVQATGEP